VSDVRLAELAQARDLPLAEVLQVLTPERGAVMAGDFGEILTFLYLGTQDESCDPIGPKKWRLKQDRQKAAPHSDVVQFIVPAWPEASDRDQLYCAEVKTKSTDGPSTPIASAIEDSKKDRLGRLAKTLAWLKERSITDDLESSDSELIDRFIKATDHPPAQKTYWAVAVICESLLGAELAEAPATPPEDCALLVIAVPDLKQRYETVFDAIQASVPES
jgi:hypothetical protein